MHLRLECRVVSVHNLHLAIVYSTSSVEMSYMRRGLDPRGLSCEYDRPHALPLQAVIHSRKSFNRGEAASEPDSRAIPFYSVLFYPSSKILGPIG